VTESATQSGDNVSTPGASFHRLSHRKGEGASNFNPGRLLQADVAALKQLGLSISGVYAESERQGCSGCSFVQGDCDGNRGDSAILQFCTPRFWITSAADNIADIV
jgi:hypothetical protein